MNLSLSDSLYDIKIKWNFMPHQIGCLDWILRSIKLHSSLLIYHKPGTGKTHIGILLAMVYSMKNSVTIVLPNQGLLSTWETCYHDVMLNTCLPFQLDNITLTTTSKFLSKINAHQSKTQEINLKDNLIIIDEAQDILNINSHEILQSVQKEFNLKLVLMTGTPIVNTPKTFVFLIYLLTGNNFKGIIEVGEHVYEIKIRPEHINEIQNALVGKISYFALHERYMPKIKEVGIFHYGINIIPCIMSKRQRYIYIETQARIKNDMFEQTLMNVSFFAIPGFYKAENVKNLEDGKIADGLFFKDGLFFGPLIQSLETSCKLKMFYEHLITGKFPGKIFIYINNSTYASLILKSINHYLEIANYYEPETYNNPPCICGVRQDAHNHVQHIFRKMTYMLINSKTLLNPAKMIAEFNSQHNLHGESIKILIGTNVLSVGYTLKELQSIHFLTHPPNKNDQDQIIARGVRVNAKTDLTVPIKIYKYAALLDKSDKTVYDMRKLLYIRSKFENTIVGEQILIDVAANSNYKDLPSHELNYILIYDLLQNYLNNYKSKIDEKDISSALMHIMPLMKKLSLQESRRYIEEFKTMKLAFGKTYIDQNSIHRIMIPYQNFLFRQLLGQESKSFEIDQVCIIANHNKLEVEFSHNRYKHNIATFTLERLYELYRLCCNILRKPVNNINHFASKQAIINDILRIVIGTRLYLRI